MKTILDLCGGTGSWSKPYVDAGYQVIVVDVKDVLQTSAELYLSDVENFMYYHPESITQLCPDRGWVMKDIYGILAAPPCTMFSHARTRASRERDVRGAMEVVLACLKIVLEVQYHVKTGEKKTPLKFWALENPNHGILKYLLGKPAYTFTPADFGHDYKKQTALWGWFNNPVKTPIDIDAPKFDSMKTKDIHGEHYGKLDRQTRRAITPSGFAKAFFDANI